MQNPNFYYSVLRSPLLDRILSRMNPNTLVRTDLRETIMLPCNLHLGIQTADFPSCLSPTYTEVCKLLSSLHVYLPPTLRYAIHIYVFLSKLKHAYLLLPTRSLEFGIFTLCCGFQNYRKFDSFHNECSVTARTETTQATTTQKHYILTSSQPMWIQANNAYIIIQCQRQKQRRLQWS